MGNHEKINELINTSVFYFSLIALAAWSISPFSPSTRTVSSIRPEDQHEFATLILITASVGAVYHVAPFLSALMASSARLTSRIMVIQVALRSIGYCVLKTGHGLVIYEVLSPRKSWLRAQLPNFRSLPHCACRLLTSGCDVSGHPALRAEILRRQRPP